MDAQKTLITDVSWGRMVVEVDGERREFRDCKVWPGGARAWDWNETGTHHEPGIQPADVAEIVQQDVEVMVLSQGQQLRLQVQAETEEMLRQAGITYHIAETKEAVALFNRLMREGERVGGIFHSTC